MTYVKKSHTYLHKQINLIAPPRYVMTTTTLERTEGLSVLNQAMAAIKERIEEKRGVFNVQMEVRCGRNTHGNHDCKLDKFIFWYLR